MLELSSFFLPGEPRYTGEQAWQGTARIAVGGEAGQGVGLSSIKLYKVRVIA